MLLAVISGFLVAILSPLIVRASRGAAGRVLAALPLALFAWFAHLAGEIDASRALLVSYPWVPSLGVSLSFRLDGLSLLFALLISGIGALVIIYAGSYLAGHAQLGRFYAYLLSFMASMLGLVLADNLLALFVFWELTSVTSYLLIGFDHGRAEARAAALQALLVTGAGGLTLLAGMLLAGHAAGTLELSAMLSGGDAIRSHLLYPSILALVLTGAFTKSAQFPFHFWLPNAMEAPAPVSAYLHSATMVKAGVYLLARLNPVLGGTPEWFATLTVFGAITMAAGAYLAFRESDLKRVLAYTTVAALGMMTMLIGIGSDLAIQGAIAFLLAHALYKGALFLVAGALEHETGARDAERLGGLYAAMPRVAGAGLLAGLSMAGFAPLFGFIAKELLYGASLHASTALISAVVAANVLYVAAAFVVAFKPLFGAPVATPSAPHDPPIAMWLGPAALAALGLLGGLAPSSVDALIAPAVTSARGADVMAHLALWHGLNAELGLSALTVALAAIAFSARRRLRIAASYLDRVYALGPESAYAGALELLAWIAAAQTRILQNGYLRYYIITILVASTGLVGFGMVRGAIVPQPAWPEDVTFWQLGIAAVIGLGAIGAAVTTSRFGAVAALGVVGYGMAILFAAFGAPDLAITQVIVDTLTVILFILVFFRLPSFARLSRERAHLRDAMVAGLAGAMLTVFLLALSGIEVSGGVAEYIARLSVPEGHGRNIVNVILVDFRSLDTLGEIVVLAVAGLGVYALIRLRPHEERAR